LLTTSPTAAGAPLFPNIVSTSTAPLVSNVVAFASNFRT
jgi:hypothetical protein